jgi:hypothetical protein
MITHPTFRRSTHGPRRGIALLLVLIAMATATTLTLGWLASQDNASLVGRNIATAAEARALACSGIDIAASITQTETLWHIAGSDGVLLAQFPLGAGTIDLTVLDQTTNAPPTEDTSELLVTATGRIGELTQIVTASISLLQDDDGTLQGEVDDFALFALRSIELSNHAVVRRWNRAPASAMKRRIAIATAGRASHGVQLRGQAAVIDGALYQTRNASNAHFINRTSLNVPTIALDWPLSLNGINQARPSRSRHDQRAAPQSGNPDDLVITHHQSVQWAHGGNIHVVGDLIIQPGATVFVAGPTTLQIDGNLTMHGSSIVLAENAELNIVVHGQVALDDAHIGDIGSHWSDPNRIHLTSEAGAEDAEEWVLAGQTRITGIVEGDGIDLLLKDQAVVRGRLATNTITMRNDSAVLFDHGLGNGLGIPQAADLLHEHVQVGRNRSKRLGPLPQRFINRLLNVSNGGQIDARDEQDTSANVFNWRQAPTPRPLAVEVRLLAHGVDPDAWEQAARILMESSQ